MEVLMVIPLILVPFFWPVITGLMAKNFGRKFWVWFWLGLPLPFIAVIILLFLPDKVVRNATVSAPVKAKILDAAFQDTKKWKMNMDETPRSISA